MNQKRETNSQDETIQFGVDFAKELKSGSVVGLFGNLGTGKTTVIKGICKGLGVQERITSPTFTILKEYQGENLIVYHFDFFRLKSFGELQEIGFEDYLYKSGVCLIEWADRVLKFLPPNRFEMYLNFGKTNNMREILVNEVLPITI